MANNLFRKTPLLEETLVGGVKVFFKLECLQYSGSFKDRGISHMIKTKMAERAISKLICSSGGNAGYSVAVCGKKLNVPVDVFVPSTTPQMMIEKLKAMNATVLVEGKNWNEADAKAQEAVAANSESLYVPPFDDPLIWEGNSSIISELQNELPEPPDAIIVSVGGGGLLRGIQLGLQQADWKSTTIIAVETEGAASFAAAKKAGHLVKLDKIDTIATTLGALQVTGSVLDNTITTIPAVVTDREAVEACLTFASKQRILVEPSCGASLSILYNERLFGEYLQNCKSIVVVVCGGNAVTFQLLEQWKARFNLQ